MLEQAVRPGQADTEVEQILAEREEHKPKKGAGADARLAVQGKGDLGGDVQAEAERGVSGQGDGESCQVLSSKSDCSAKAVRRVAWVMSVFRCRRGLGNDGWMSSARGPPPAWSPLRP